MKNNKAFTCIEVMIVFAIVGCLFAIAVPSFKKARQTAILNEHKVSTLDNVINGYEVIDGPQIIPSGYNTILTLQTIKQKSTEKQFLIVYTYQGVSVTEIK